MESSIYGFEGTRLLFTDDTDFHFDSSRNLSYSQFRETSTDLCNSTSTLNSLMEFTTRFSSSINGSDANIDEKLLAPTESNCSRFSESAKRGRITNLQPQIPTCQVLGCNKDLSPLKDYYKRHKVCDVHSKTGVVVVNGTQQRFCQQCSRFHGLLEFDEGKRSCRKRLAGHNQRRRKPQFNPHLGSTYFTMNVPKPSFLFSGFLPGAFLGLKYDESPICAKRLKLEDDLSQIYDPKSILHLHGMSKDHPDNSLSVRELNVGSNSSCALSLLSAQSHNSSAMTQNSVEPLDKSMSQSLSFTTSGVINKGMPSEGFNTVNLIQLSLNLQRVEQQKYYAGIKPETGVLLPHS